ncbi:hypothetical protein GEV33_001936 [Tenebrio molitor]|uniref:Uncharacterized protein n=1 Tax=Tenebrio molitor TaxID=7067 RepID=A0A8J6HLB5_TENMO|nr:hypothetical protein GEV33_001936 [Tenebrio molitor]
MPDLTENAKVLILSKLEEGWSIRIPKDLSDELLERKIQLCQELLEVADILEPGHSRFRGSLLYDLHEAMMVQVRRGGGEGVEDKAKSCLKEAAVILDTEPDFKEIVRKKLESLRDRDSVALAAGTDGLSKAHTLAVAVFFCGDRGRAVHPKLHKGLLQVLPDHPTQPRNVAL